MAFGDFDADGYAVVAEDDYDGTRSNSGRVFIFRGGAGGLAGTPDVTLEGQSTGARLGTNLVVGDFDGDGREDLAVTAPYASVESSGDGAIYVWLGTSFGAEAPDLTWTSGLESALCGDALHAADLDGDGLDELVVGCPTAAVSFYSAGRVYVVPGAPARRAPPCYRSGVIGSLRFGSAGGRGRCAGERAPPRSCLRESPP
ncbi:MAG: VCBS repeat-containing protein [Pseudomonadota bacterium]|nr:VCBS repeat-containing protein [Pseudomonadota bacterium]